MYARGARVLDTALTPRRGPSVDSGHFPRANARRRALPASQSMRRRAPLDLRLERCDDLAEHAAALPEQRLGVLVEPVHVLL